MAKHVFQHFNVDSAFNMFTIHQRAWCICIWYKLLSYSTPNHIEEGDLMKRPALMASSLYHALPSWCCHWKTFPHSIASGKSGFSSILYALMCLKCWFAPKLLYTTSSSETSQTPELFNWHLPDVEVFHCAALKTGCGLDALQVPAGIWQCESGEKHS